MTPHVGIPCPKLRRFALPFPLLFSLLHPSFPHFSKPTSVPSPSLWLLPLPLTFLLQLNFTLAFLHLLSLHAHYLDPAVWRGSSGRWLPFSPRLGEVGRSHSSKVFGSRDNLKGRTTSSGAICWPFWTTALFLQEHVCPGFSVSISELKKNKNQ